jgi:hypothetical protein
MRRGAISAARSARRIGIAAALEAQRVSPALARRVALQLVFKIPDSELGDHAIWHSAGQILFQEAARLRNHLGLVERQIDAVLPKLSARRIEEFLDELRAADRRIARTIFNAAIESANPIAAGRRYLEKYQSVARELKAFDPSLARTIANASFTAGAPQRKALEHLQRFMSARAALTALAILLQTPG